ncbi:MAG: hypothetical protein WD845_11615 [Pirellulales bacterium]
MLAPQFSLRRLLAWVSFSALVCLIGAAAARGQLWAVAALVGLFGLSVVLMVHGLTYGLLRLLGTLRDRRSRNTTVDVGVKLAPP